MLRLFMIDDGDSISSESVKAPEGIFNKKIVRISKYVDVNLKLEIGMLVCMSAKIFKHKWFVEGFADGTCTPILELETVVCVATPVNDSV